jgi:hypothetical protein
VTIQKEGISIPKLRAAAELMEIFWLEFQKYANLQIAFTEAFCLI